VLLERLQSDAVELEQYARVFASRVEIRVSDRVPGGPPCRWRVRPRTVALKGLRPGADPAACRFEDLVLDAEPCFSLSLPEGYPRARPRLRSVRPMFHPNVDRDTGDVCYIAPPAWTPGLSLAWVVDQAIAIAGYQKFNEYRTFDFLDEGAARWAQSHPHLVRRIRELAEPARPAGEAVHLRSRPR